MDDETTEAAIRLTDRIHEILEDYDDSTVVIAALNMTTFEQMRRMLARNEGYTSYEELFTFFDKGLRVARVIAETPGEGAISSTQHKRGLN